MNKTKLVEILKIQSESYNQFRMFAYIIRELKKLNVDYYTYNGCIYAQKGNSDTFPCIVSHMDTVHDIVEDLTPIEINGNITGFNSYTMEQTGIGGDDKVGIFIALECISKFKNIKAVFFRDEEIGCVGSYRPDINFFTDCSFILQCDRRGNSDFITNASGIELSSYEFQNDISPIISKYGYKFNNGAMTDVMALKQCKINISMANISCGYYNPHSPQEYVNIKDVENTLNLVEEIIQNIGHIKYIHEYKEKTYTYKHKKYKYDIFDNYNIKSTKSICDICFQNHDADSIVHSREYGMNICTKCTEDYSIPCR